MTMAYYEKKTAVLLFTVCLLNNYLFGQTNSPLHYNSTTYPTVITAAQQVGFPFLLVQGYPVSATGYEADTAKSSVTFKGQTYQVTQQYNNPNGKFPYYVPASSYATYAISPIEKETWPTKIQNLLYNPTNQSFCSYVDCVGYGTRLLSLTDANTNGQNAYTNLRTYIRNLKSAPFAASGYEASAYEYAVSFPLLTNNNNSGWQYVCGNVSVLKVDSFNRTKKINTAYTGKSKGGFAQAMPGDILSFGYDNGQDNGHFMVIEKSPIPLSNIEALKVYYPMLPTATLDSLLNKCSIYAVPLFDCSGQNVHFFDSRKKTSGIGHGTILIYADKATDTPFGFVFSPPAKPGFIGLEQMGNHLIALTVGRYTPTQK